MINWIALALNLVCAGHAAYKGRILWFLFFALFSFISAVLLTVDPNELVAPEDAEDSNE